MIHLSHNFLKYLILKRLKGFIYFDKVFSLTPLINIFLKRKNFPLLNIFLVILFNPKG